MCIVLCIVVTTSLYNIFGPLCVVCLCCSFLSLFIKMKKQENDKITAAEQSMYRHRPASEKTQDISHILSSVFKELYTLDVLGKDTVANLVKSRGSNNQYHERYVEELQKIHTEYNQRVSEADMVEKHIIQARAQATAEEERALNKMIEEVGDKYYSLGLPPVESTFRWCVDSTLLRKHNLICPDDYITQPAFLTNAPKGKPEPHYTYPTFNFKQHTDRSSEESVLSIKTAESLLAESESTLTLSSNPEVKCSKQTSKKSNLPKKSVWKEEMSTEDRVQDRAYLAMLEERHNFLKNPRFLPPNDPRGGKSLIIPQNKIEKVIAGRKMKAEIHGPYEPIPVFVPYPSIVFFTGYQVGQIYETVVELRNVTSASHHIRIIPPSTPYFSIGLGRFPGKGGIVAPGMSCHYTVRFAPDSLMDYEDFILVETQALYPLAIPVEARRPPPILTLPRVLECGPCLVGGMKITEYLCLNEGFSTGKFCIMPKKAWPTANFRGVAGPGFVEQSPFIINPTIFELYPGQAIFVEVAFFPFAEENFTETFTIVCDNCQVKDVTVTGLGQLVALELVSVTEGEHIPEPGELTDLTAEHFICFESLNPHAVTQKSLVIRNTTHVELPFHWQIMKPNLQHLMPEEPINPASIQFIWDAESAFSVIPSEGSLQPHSEHEFQLCYSPLELNDYHSVLHLVLRDIPEPQASESKTDSEKEKQMIIAEKGPSIRDVIVMEIDVKGSTESFNVLLEPYAILFAGENITRTTIRRQFKMLNNSKSAISYKWDRIVDCHIMEVQPHSGTIDSKTSMEFELCLTGGKSESAIFDLHCYIEHQDDLVTLHVEAAFKGPVVSIDIPSLHLGLLKLGDSVQSTICIKNYSQLSAQWIMQESLACLRERDEEVSQFLINPSSGELPPLSTCNLSILFKPLKCQSLETVLELKIESAESSYLTVQAEVQNPQVCLLSSQLAFGEVYVGIPVQGTAKLFNQTSLPANYSWIEIQKNDLTQCTVTVSPSCGTLRPNEELELYVEFTAFVVNDFTDVAIFCTVDGMQEPLILGILAEVKGLLVTYSLPHQQDIESEVQASSSELLLDFGSEVPLSASVTRQLILTNHSAISASFSFEVEYFSAPSGQQINCSRAVLKKGVSKAAASKTQQDRELLLLSHGKGATFCIQTSSGTLSAFQEQVIEMTAYNNMWGEYSDHLICKVGDLEPTVIPLKMIVRGCPLYFQMGGPPKQQARGPVVRFGTHISGGDTVSRSLRINNMSPYDIRLNWQTYNKEKGDSQLLDLLVSYGDPFPRKDADGNELIGSIAMSTGCKYQMSDWDKIPSSSSVTTSTSLQTDYYFREEAESANEGDNEVQTGMKLISVNLKVHEGIASDYPYCVTPEQTVIPAQGSATIHVSFTPLTLSGEAVKVECLGYALGFMSLDHKLAVGIPGKVKRLQGYAVLPLRLDLQAFVKPALLTVEMDDEDEGMVFYSAASDLISNNPQSKVKKQSVTARSMKVTNSTETPLYFRTIVTSPFGVHVAGPKSSPITAQTDSEDQSRFLVLQPLQHLQVKVSFCLSLDLLTYQHQPSDSLPSGVQLLQSENGEKKLEFKQQLVIEYSNKSRQMLPLCAYLTVPALQLSCDTVDFGTCYVGQTHVKEAFLMNRSGSDSYWSVQYENCTNDSNAFSVSPMCGNLEAHVIHISASRQPLQISFTARDSKEYEATLIVNGMLGEQPCRLHLKGCGSYDEKYEKILVPY
ncbi:deleted in lung and esophageal cancer protein 1 [Protopterus annectens]|uniref:deleted in lung and esophageal cancer protein 1 n=1 Tax=Protopterus annectens TaxID=7888 RepID=UPI001CFB7402|nr:deleted in lung and esophageal cancer protein 1 [Protopterus annectens]